MVRKLAASAVKSQLANSFTRARCENCAPTKKTSSRPLSSTTALVHAIGQAPESKPQDVSRVRRCEHCHRHSYPTDELVADLSHAVAR